MEIGGVSQAKSNQWVVDPGGLAPGEGPLNVTQYRISMLSAWDTWRLHGSIHC